MIERQKPDPERLAVLKMLPQEIVKNFTKEELDAFLWKDVWPESMKEKLKPYLEDE